MCECHTARARSANAAEKILPVPTHVMDVVHGEIAQAHLSLNALISMMEIDGVSPDPICVARLLQYIETGLMRSDELITQFVPRS